MDPHVWNDPLAAIHMSETVRDALIEADPAHADAYRQQQATLAGRLQALDTQLRGILAPYGGRGFLVFHPAWGYFARRYGLQQLAIEHQGKQSGARWMKDLIDRAKREDIRVIVVQPQFDQRMAGQIAQAIGGHLADVDPLSPDYQGSLLRLAHVIAGGKP
jgi:zinc transport system substrate-binding protein